MGMIFGMFWDVLGVFWNGREMLGGGVCFGGVFGVFGVVICRR